MIIMNSLRLLLGRLGTFLDVSFLLLALIVLLSSRETTAFEKWERPLGWNPQYGPRYVVFWGGSSNSKDLLLGTSTYSHYASPPDSTSIPLTSFEDIPVSKLYEEALLKGSSPLIQDEHMVDLNRLPFYETSSPSSRGLSLNVSVATLPRLLKTLKTLVLYLSLDYLQRLKELEKNPSAASAAKFEAEGARLLVVMLEVYNLINKEKDLSSDDERAASVSSRLQLISRNIQSQHTWDADRFMFWVESACYQTEEGLPYYNMDIESSLWQLSLKTLSLSSVNQEGLLNQLLSVSPSPYKDCDHFIFSQALNNIAGKDLICKDSFFAATAAIQKATKQIAAISSERGKYIIEEAAQKLQIAVTEAAKLVKPESPFYSVAVQLLKETQG